jgi:hypothetical protein
MRKIGRIDFKKHLFEDCAEIVENETINNLKRSIHRYIFQ